LIAIAGAKTFLFDFVSPRFIVFLRVQEAGHRQILRSGEWQFRQCCVAGN
jgi:hypothetical protein